MIAKPLCGGFSMREAAGRSIIWGRITQSLAFFLPLLTERRERDLIRSCDLWLVREGSRLLFVFDDLLEGL